MQPFGYIRYTLINQMGKLIKRAELAIFIFAIVLIFVSEYIYVILKDPTRAIFLGLWPPTIILVLVYFNQKVKH